MDRKIDLYLCRNYESCVAAFNCFCRLHLFSSVFASKNSPLLSIVPKLQSAICEERRAFRSGGTLQKWAYHFSISLDFLQSVGEYFTADSVECEEGLLYFRRFNTGPGKTTSVEDNTIIEKMVQIPFESTSNVVVNQDLLVCYNTVRNRLRDAGSHYAMRA